ncbi:MAG: hypothetical protein LQ341_000191 [Variospora aurantia]|nr:MAG: hypothetical protein LQ341_000191 [Variospora aurantia]
MLGTLEHLIKQHPDYRLILVGHSLGGAVAALASLEFHAKGWGPQITTFGEPRVGNQALAEYIDEVFYDQNRGNASDRYRRVTHVDDLVPLLPLSEWGYTSHGEEIYISKFALPPENADLRLCEGHSDPQCISGAETTVSSLVSRLRRRAVVERFTRWWLKRKGVLNIPARFRVWELFFAHRDYFWRLGLCIPGGDPKGWHNTSGNPSLNFPYVDLFAAQRLIRFLAKDGRVYYGDAILTPGITNLAKATHARVIRGDLFGKHDVTDQIVEVRLLLAPLAREDVKTIRCLGLNYEQHAKESRMPLPKYPVLFYKPVTALTGPFDNIPVAAPAQQVEGLDYECELVAIIGKEARDVPESKALEYVLGYAVGNDVSHREWQLKRGGGQWALGKGFDGWAPFGPGGRSHLAKSLARPQGVGSGRSPPLWLNNGDVVEVSLEGVGTCTNKVEYAQSMPKL